MHQDQSIQLFSSIFKKVGRQWKTFVTALRASAEEDDPAQIFFENFLKVCADFKVHLSDHQKWNLLMSFPGRDEGDRKRMNVSRMYDQKYNILLAKMYRKVDVHEDDGRDDPVDVSGYTG